MSGTELERLVVRLQGESQSYTKMMGDAQKLAAQTEQTFRQTESAAAGAGRGLTSLAGTVKMYSGVMLSALGVTTAFGTAQRALNLAAMTETNEISFGVMLRSAEAGKKMTVELQKMADTTPMTSRSLQQAASTLLQFGVKGEKVLPILKMVGDAVGGDAEKFQRLSLAFGQMSSTGHLMGQDLLQMVNAGFNPLQQMAEKMGGDVEMNMRRLHKQMEAGGISVGMVTKAFKEATAEGGQFAGMMEKQAQSLTGMWSTLEDTVDGVLRSIGQSLVEGLNMKGFMKDLTAAGGAIKKWLDELSPQAKAFASAVLAISLAIGAVTAAVMLLGFVWNTMFAEISLPLKLIIVGIAAAVGVVALLAAEMGGIGALWEVIKNKAKEFWEWLLPIRQAVSSLWDLIVQGATTTWAWVKERAGEAWAWIRERTGLDWEAIRATIVDAILMVEFALRNFGAVADVAWKGFKYYAMVALNSVLKHIFLIIGGPLLLPAFVAMQVNWGKLWNAIVSAGAGAMEMIVKMFHEVGGLNLINLLLNPTAEGTAMATKLVLRFRKDIARAAKGTKVDWFGVEIPALKGLEEEWKKEFDAAKAGLGQSWDQFREQKMNEWAKTPAGAKAAAEEAGKELGEGIGAGMNKEIKHAEANLVGSLHDALRIQEYTDDLYAMGFSPYARGKKGDRAEMQRLNSGYEPNQPRNDGGGSDWEYSDQPWYLRKDGLSDGLKDAYRKQDEATRELTEEMRKAANRPQIVINDANLGGN